MTVYEVTDAPPSSTGSSHDTRSVSSRTVAVTFVGAAGRSARRMQPLQTTVSTLLRTTRSRNPRGVPAATPIEERISWALTTTVPVTETPGDLDDGVGRQVGARDDDRVRRRADAEHLGRHRDDRRRRVLADRGVDPRPHRRHLRVDAGLHGVGAGGRRRQRRPEAGDARLEPPALAVGDEERPAAVAVAGVGGARAGATMRLPTMASPQACWHVRSSTTGTSADCSVSEIVEHDPGR